MRNLTWSTFGWIHVVIMALTTAAWWVVGIRAQASLVGWLTSLAVVMTIELVVLFPLLRLRAIRFPWLGLDIDPQVSEQAEVALLVPMRLHSFIRRGVSSSFSPDLFAVFKTQVVEDMVALNGPRNGFATVDKSEAHQVSGPWSLEIKHAIERLVAGQADILPLCDPRDLGFDFKFMKRAYAIYHTDLDTWFVGWTGSVGSLHERHERAVEAAVRQLRSAYLLCWRSSTTIDLAVGRP